MMKYEITDYRLSDRTELLRFFRAVFAEMGFDFDLASKDRDVDHITEEYQSRNGLFLLAKNGNGIAGTIAVRRTIDSEYELKRFYVLNEHRRHGLGTGLLSRVLRHVQSCDGRSIRLDTTHKSQAAISLFTRHGFVEIPRFNEDPFAEIFMELKIEGKSEPEVGLRFFAGANKRVSA